MNFSFNERLEERILNKVASGRYASAEDVIEEAMQLLEARDLEGEKIRKELEGREEEIREKLELGLKDLREGRYTTYTSETLHELEEEIITRGRKRLEEYRKSLQP